MLSEVGYVVDFSNVTTGAISYLIGFERYFFKTYTMSGSGTIQNNKMRNTGDGKGVLFQIGDSAALQTVNGAYTTITLSGQTFLQNYCINSAGLLLPYVRSFN